MVFNLKGNGEGRPPWEARGHVNSTKVFVITRVLLLATINELGLGRYLGSPRVDLG